MYLISRLLARRKEGRDAQAGTVALEFLLLLPFIVALAWMVLWAGEAGRTSLLTTLTAEEAATVAATTRDNLFRSYMDSGMDSDEAYEMSAKGALNAAEDYVDNKFVRFGDPCKNVPEAAVDAAWWRSGKMDRESFEKERGQDAAPGKTLPIADDSWLVYPQSGPNAETVEVEFAVVRVRCESRFRFALPVYFLSRVHEAIAWEAVGVTY